MSNEYIPKVLKEYRKKNHYSVNDVSLMLRERSLEVAPKTIYGWESGQANPSADMLLTLCEMYNITDILSTFGYDGNENFHVTSAERTIVEAYRAHPELQEAVEILLGCRAHRHPQRSRLEAQRKMQAQNPRSKMQQGNFQNKQ